ncbi:MAG: antibiotic biosynthesis monooxygenase [Muribaculaceae bacterium]|nr:antibiotic biosynthesis monooxygenase [Muribaculaceae bacterium]
MRNFISLIIVTLTMLSMTGQNMCKKLPMQPDGIVRLSKIQVNPEYLDEYMKFAVEVGTTSLETEPGILTMYAVADKDNPCNITILETYASQDAYKSHIASEHFQKYKQGTLHMVDSLRLDDVKPLNKNNILTNTIKQ